MARKINPPRWLGRPIVDPHHANVLERNAAAHEFLHGHRREDAERKAHEDYLKEFHEKAAGHHLQGMKIAQAAGEPNHAHKHRLLYDLHMKALNLDPMAAVPAQIQAHAEQNPGRATFYKFHPHKGDLFLFEPKE